ncbi:hypothetical protein EV175_000856 [Coemansia sp. RSA 1933]|nr:hypothetical protein EV175_000856 [Coemansia sp. RSA 1933]
MTLIYELKRNKQDQQAAYMQASSPFNWTNATDVDAMVSSEMDILNRIAEVLDGKSLDLIYPRVVCGGDVRFQRDGEYVTNDTMLIYKYNKRDKQQVFRVQRHLCTALVGDPLNSVRNEKELM